MSPQGLTLQGLTHLLLMQTSLLGHSGSERHSGRGGLTVTMGVSFQKANVSLHIFLVDRHISLQFTFNTANEWISTLAWRAIAYCLMVSASTIGCWSASDCFADLNADAIESIANFLSGAIVVTLTSDRDANDGWIALHTSRAVALRTMESDAA